MTATAHDVTAMLIDVQHRAGRQIDKMQLQKLLYLVQGANLEFWGEPAFREAMSAYRRGPVQVDVEKAYRHVVDGVEPIPGAVDGDPDRLDETVVDTVLTVLRCFGSWSAVEMESYVKSGDSPWHRARVGVFDGEPSDAEIQLSDIAEWFAHNGVDPELRQEQHWEPTPEERAAANDRLQRAKEHGAFLADIPADVLEIVDRSVANAVDVER